MKQSIAMLIVLVAVGCGRTGDPRLSGSFVSDKPATLSYLDSTCHYDTNQLAFLGALFGRLQVTYSGGKLITLLDGYTETRKFRIVDSGPNHVSIETKFGFEEHLGEVMMVTNRIEFTPDGYWVTSPMMESPFKEKFVKKRDPTSASTAANQSSPLHAAD